MYCVSLRAHNSVFHLTIDTTESIHLCVLLFKISENDYFIYHVRKSKNLYDMWSEVAPIILSFIQHTHDWYSLHRGNKIVKVIAILDIV